MSDSSHTHLTSLIKKGRYFEAFNLAEKYIQEEPANNKIRQQYGLVLARLGMLDRARAYLWDLHQKFPDDAETAGILGSVLKSIYKQTLDHKDALLSRDIYLDNYRKNKSFYTGINAASMSVIIGDQKMAALIADEITQAIPSDSKDFWEQVTLGEAYLLLGKISSARDWYSRASNAIERDYGIFNSVYSQLVLLEAHLDVPDELKAHFKPPTMVVFTGHMIDHPERTVPRFPESIADHIAKEIARILREVDARIGYSSLACGADILFVEEMIKRKAEINLFLPYNMKDFMASSVSYAGPSWVNRFQAILDKHDVHYITEEGYFGNDDLHALLGTVIFGKCVLRAESMNAEPSLLTVLSPSGSKDPVLVGGTEYLVQKWPFKRNMYTIDPVKLLTSTEVDSVTPSRNSHTISVQETSREIRHILFADVVGYSKLGEDKTPQFVEKLLYDISGQISALPHHPEILNTWGDSIFAVYSDIRQMMDFALALHRAVKYSSWEDVGEVHFLSMRIALHTGPVFLLNDPVTNRRNAFGAHVNRAARMEPVTMPGSIFASDQFASVLKIECLNEYRLEYVGVIDLPKEFGKQEMYRIDLVRK